MIANDLYTRDTLHFIAKTFKKSLCFFALAIVDQTSRKTIYKPWYPNYYIT